MKPDILDKGLPSAPDVERLVLGMVLLNDEFYGQVSEVLSTSDFSLEKHRRIFSAMQELASRGEDIDSVTLSGELERVGYLESAGGRSYLISLDDGLPSLPHIASYLKTIKDKSHLRQIIFAAESVKQRAMLAEDAPQIIASAGEDLLRPITAGDVKDRGRTPLEVITQFPGGVEAFFDHSKRPTGIRTGFPSFDEATGGFKPSQMWVVAARTRHGKSAAAGNIATHVLLEYPVRAFSLEMSAAAWIERMISDKGSLHRAKFRSDMRQEDRARAQQVTEWLASVDFAIYDRASMPMSAIMRQIQRECAKWDRGGLVILDHIQLLGRDRGSKFGSRQEEVASNSRLFKMACKDYGVTGLLISQLGRGAEKHGDGFPQLFDLKESGAIEEDADGVLLIYRPGLGKPDRQDLKEEAYWIIAKQRDGDEKRIKMRWQGGFMRFSESIDTYEESD